VQNRSYGCQMGTGGYAGNSESGQVTHVTGGNTYNQGAPQKRVEIVETGTTTTGNTGIRCYNYNGKGHLANACPKLRTRAVNSINKPYFLH
jgi:hypothetical protein